MRQTHAIVDTLKRQLKAQGRTYADAAQVLDLSEASVKRLFAEQNFTLERLDQLCEWLGIDVLELARLTEQGEKRTTQLSMDQEKEIAADPILLAIAVSALNGFRFADFLAQYKITEPELIRKLARLDKIKFIELLPNNRIKLLVSPNFTWLPNGPIQKFFLAKVAGDFFRVGFDQETESLLVVNGLISAKANREMQEKMRALVREYNQLAESERPLEIDAKQGTTLVVALRRWRYSLFDQFVR